MSNRIRLGAVAVGVLVVAGIVLSFTLARNGLPGGAGGSTAVGGAEVTPNGPTAPELVGIAGWENSPPLRIADLRGKVVLVDSWTYSCINCQRTLPYLRQWWDRYQGQGLVIIGVHSPEFDFEKSPSNVHQAVGQLGVRWPVALDSDMKTWRAYQNHYWPAEYLIDRRGQVRHTHFGEGEYDVTERAIQQLLSEGGSRVSALLSSADPGLSGDAASQTAETYAGTDRGNGSIHLEGRWSIQKELAAVQDGTPPGPGSDYAELAYQARRVFVVGGAAGPPVRVWVTLDGHDPPAEVVGSDVHFDGSRAYFTVDHHDLYHVISMSTFSRHLIRLAPESGGFQLFTFTFGS